MALFDPTVQHRPLVTLSGIWKQQFLQRFPFLVHLFEMLIDVIPKLWAAVHQLLCALLEMLQAGQMIQHVLVVGLATKIMIIHLSQMQE